MKKNKAKVLSSILGYSILFIILLLSCSLRWFETEWGDITIETVVYQLDSPLKGTPANLIMSYITSSILPGCLVIVLLIILGLMIKNKNYIIKFTIRIKHSLNTLEINAKTLHIFRVILIVGLITGSSIYIYSQCVRLKIDWYINTLSNASSFFEDNYISPTESVITFPSQKRNLLLIYIESMETTYTSRVNGGGKENDYIKELQQLATSNTTFSNTEKLGGAWQCYGTGWTIAAQLSSSAGVPYKLPIGGNDAGNYELFLPGIKTLGDVLEENGYNNYFMCGTDIDFAGTKQFYQQHGNYEIFDLSNKLYPR